MASAHGAARLAAGSMPDRQPGRGGVCVSRWLAWLGDAQGCPGLVAALGPGSSRKDCRARMAVVETDVVVVGVGSVGSTASWLRAGCAWWAGQVYDSWAVFRLCG